MNFPLACRVKNPLHQDGAHVCALKNLWGKTGPAVKAGSVIQMFWPPVSGESFMGRRSGMLSMTGTW